MYDRRISVCMATYNGLPYLEEQLTSILNQLGAEDEVIVVDDGSRDGTRDVLRQHPDPRLRVLLHERNLGLIGTFEDAVRAARGQFIFLSDQDDIWAPGKVEKYLAAFAADPDTSIVCSRVLTIDEQGRRLTQQNVESGRPFRTGLLANFVHNNFQGSTMALRASVLPEVLPFPRGGERYQLLHDLWIGVRAARCGLRAVRLEEPLLYYRRHTQNASGGLALWGQIEKRVRLLALLLRRH